MWRKLEIANDWGYDFYRLKSKNYKQADYDDQVISFQEDEIIKVIWPNKKETKEKIVYKPFQNEINDHGKTSYVNGDLPVIETVVNGVKVLIKLDQIKVWL